MHLIIKYHQTHGQGDETGFPPEHEWLPSWRIDGPDEPGEGGRGAVFSLTGEKRLPIVKPGEHLKAGDVYLDLKNPAVGPFVALDGQTAGEGNAYVHQGDLSASYWNQLVRICSRAGALMFDPSKCSPHCEVTLVLEPLVPMAEPVMGLEAAGA
jgi:hypothetical protein